MQPRISVRHEKISEGTKEHIVQSCAKLEKYCDRIVDCEVIIDKDKAGYKTEFIVKVPQQTLTATATSDNLYKAVAEAEGKLETQIKKYHDKQIAHH